MQGYTRKIAYLYEYKDGEQMKSAGFVKVEARGGVCRIDIHLKSYCHTGEEAGKVYIYFYYQKHPVGICLGALESRNGALEWQGILDAENIQDKGVSLAETRGIWVRRPDHRQYVADWDDYPVDVRRFLLFPSGGKKCIRCPWFGSCERSMEHAVDRRGEIYEGSHPAGA